MKNLYYEKFFRVVRYLIIQICVITLGLEGAIRIFKPAPLFEVISVTTGDQMQYVLSPNELLVYRPKPNSGQLNEQGARGALHSLEKSPGVFRIALIGDSVAEGAGVPPPSRFSELLEQSRSPRTEIVNLGVRGYNILQYYEYLVETGLQYQPDMVLVGVTYNDLSVAAWEVEELRKKLYQIQNSRFYETYYGVRNKLERFLLRYSHVYRYVRFLSSGTETEKYAGGFPEIHGGRIATSALDTTMDKFRTLASEQHLPLVFVVFPTSANPEQSEAIAQSARNHGFEVWDLNAEATKIGWPKSDFLENDPCHLSVEGHRALASMLAEHLKGVGQGSVAR